MFRVVGLRKSTITQLKEILSYIGSTLKSKVQ